LAAAEGYLFLCAVLPRSSELLLAIHASAYLTELQQKLRRSHQLPVSSGVLRSTFCLRTCFWCLLCGPVCLICPPCRPQLALGLAAGVGEAEGRPTPRALLLAAICLIHQVDMLGRLRDLHGLTALRLPITAEPLSAGPPIEGSSGRKERHETAEVARFLPR
jgi:hypothetical protein